MSRAICGERLVLPAMHTVWPIMLPFPPVVVPSCLSPEGWDRTTDDIPIDRSFRDSHPAARIVGALIV